ncbi:MAG TPA: DUF4136 domain-containing protein [Candidatus Acidoferrum sp.]|nr:DUF4136 domain-containing protein [Candidatus Acidoferrum sp.]
MKFVTLKHEVVLACLFFNCLTASGQKVSTINEPSFDFSKHKRYAWLENRLMTRQHPDTNETMNLKIVRAVDQTLKAKGFVEDKQNPDFYLNYDGGGESNLALSPTAQVNSAPKLSNDPTPTYGLGNGPAMAPAAWLKVDGRISFRMIDAVSKKQVWAATYVKTFRDPDKALRRMDKEVDELVTKSFKNFPPKQP